jgi:ribose 5-phosphate isomerase B
MKVVLGSDHNGVEFKKMLIEHLQSTGYEIEDAGPVGNESVDYPDYAFEAAEKVSSGEADRGILICGSGIGMSMAANKVVGVRAALCFTPESAALSRRHNDANVLALAGRVTRPTSFRSSTPSCQQDLTGAGTHGEWTKSASTNSGETKSENRLRYSCRDRS